MKNVLFRSAGQEIALKSSPEERENDLLKTQLKQLQDCTLKFIVPSTYD
jgi:hypothetical protein